MMPEEYVDAARIDGASAWQMTLHVTLPYLKGVLLVAGLFRLIDSIKAFPLIYILTDGGPGTVTEVTNFYSFLQAFNFSYLGYSSAITVVLVAVTVADKLGHRPHRRLGARWRREAFAYSPPWERRAVYALVIVLVVLVHGAVRLAGRHELQDRPGHLRLPADAAVHADARQLRRPLGSAVPPFVRSTAPS